MNHARGRRTAEEEKKRAIGSRGRLEKRQPAILTQTNLHTLQVLPRRRVRGVDLDSLAIMRERLLRSQAGVRQTQSEDRSE